MMISNLNADGRPSLWYVLITGEVKGWGYSTFTYDEKTEAVVPCDRPLPGDPMTMRHFRNQDGTIRAEPRPKTRIEVLRAKRRTGEALTLTERDELLDLLLGV